MPAKPSGQIKTSVIKKLRRMEIPTFLSVKRYMILRKNIRRYSVPNWLQKSQKVTKHPDNLPDVTSITNAISQLSALGVNTTEIVTDNGYYSGQNFSELLLAGFDFITLAKTSVKWISPEIDKQREAQVSWLLCPCVQ